jgi:acetyl esterase/lipase
LLEAQALAQIWYFFSLFKYHENETILKLANSLEKAAVLCHQAKVRGVTIHGQLLRIPVVCQSDPHYRELGLESMNYFHDTPILCRQSMVQFLAWYNPTDAADISVSPLLATDFAGLPPAYIQICGRDPLRDEGLAYADKLEQSG